MRFQVPPMKTNRPSALGRMSAAVSADPDFALRLHTRQELGVDPDFALRLHTRQELGVDPDDLPSPVLAGVASLIAFSLGALLPLLPYLLGLRTLVVPLVVAGVALLTGGVVVGRLTGRPLVFSGLRQLVLGALAVIVTFGIGHLIGATPS